MPCDYIEELGFSDELQIEQNTFDGRSRSLELFPHVSGLVWGNPTGFQYIN